MAIFYEVVKPITGHEVGDRIEDGLLSDVQLEHLARHGCIVRNEDAVVEDATAIAAKEHEAKFAPLRAAATAELKAGGEKLPVGDLGYLRVVDKGGKNSVQFLPAGGSVAALSKRTPDQLAEICGALGIKDPEDPHFAILEWMVSQAG